MAIVNKPDMNYGIWAEGGNTEIPSSEKVEEGWVIEKPLNEQMNWLQNRQDKMLQYLNQRGMAEWDFKTEYPKDAYVVRSGKMYQAKSQNKDADPTLNTQIWRMPFALSGVADGAGGEIEKIKNQDGYLSHYVRKTAPVMTAAAKGVAYNDTTGVSGLSFSGNKPVISSNGRVVAEFSGGASPKDVVTHEQLGVKLQGYLVGDVYLTTSSGDPSTRLGYGSWVRYGEGRALVGFSAQVSNSVPQWVKSVNTQFGAYDHNLTVNEMPNHKHSHSDKFQHYMAKHFRGESIGQGDYDQREQEWQNHQISAAEFSASLDQKVGGGVAHNNVQPSIVVYMWRRTA